MILENFPQTILTKIKIGFLGFRVLSGGNIRKFVIKVHFIYLSLYQLGFFCVLRWLVSAGDTKITGIWPLPSRDSGSQWQLSAKIQNYVRVSEAYLSCGLWSLYSLLNHEGVQFLAY